MEWNLPQQEKDFRTMGPGGLHLYPASICGVFGLKLLDFSRV